MITNDDLYKKYGKDIVFLFKGGEPFVEALGNPSGVLIERDDKVLCYECEEWFEQLTGPPHISHLLQVHNMKADEYKEKYGFNRHAPLCSRKMSAEHQELAYAAIRKDPTIKQKVYTGRMNALKKIRGQGYTMRGSKKRTQGLNARNACAEQMKQRYRMLQLKYGKDVGLNQIRQVDSGVEGWGVRHYGSWNNFKIAMGEPIDTSSYAKEASELIYDLRDYVDEYAKAPWDPYTKKALNGFPHSQAPYVRRFKTISNAMLVAGITSVYQVIDGRPRKVFSIAYDVDLVDEAYLQEADRSVRRLLSRAMPPLEKRSVIESSMAPVKVF